uniref:NADH-ubiquinone oxidoreductase chain 5 n=1 Tax=Phrosinella nasuta TaxID=2689308 RepID=A0A8A5L275_9MUSC|nr:NADH dehydrogenase subunit 5 [Phrosinella nasuta]QTF74301.1 NADH dehydrogenase subunit 5 [Phrosinella nasuta]
MCKISFIFLFLFSSVSFFMGIIFIQNNYSIFIEWEVVSFNSMMIVMTLLFDWMSFIFASFVFMISSVVIFYSSEYMEDDYKINRFIILVLMFVTSMMLLIFSPNLISILLGWDGLGLVSYCLVIYFQNVKSYNAGMLTALSNRIGDVALLLSIAWMLNYGGWNYIFYLEVMKNDMEMEIIGALVMLAAMTKSAQIPFSSWLPAAMAAPTPVSALVHSSTLVTAGVYLLIRFNIVLSISLLGNLLLLLSGLTMFMSGLGANYEFDLKKIIALSTLSQLGLMMSILSMGYYKLAFFHLLTHALFKALLFMCAGCIIHNMNNTQDIRFMGSLSLSMPLTSSCFNVANLALCGMPFLAGFYSKDLILEVVSLSYINVFSFILYFLSTGLTVCYSFRLVYYTMTGDFIFYSLNMLNDEGWVMLSSMMVLLLLSIIGGSMLSWVIFASPVVVVLPFYLKMLVLLVCFLGGFMGYLVSNVSLFFVNKSFMNYTISYFLGSMWFMPYISTYGLMNYYLKLGYNSFKVFDQGWSEYFGGNQLYFNLIKGSQLNQMLQNNSLKIYLLSFIFWVMGFYMFMIWV